MVFFPNFNRTSEDPDQTLNYAMSYLGIPCLPMSHKKNARLILFIMSGIERYIKVNFVKI